MRKANYQIVMDGKEFLVIKDLGPWDRVPTVTNDAEEVVKELAPQLKGRQLLYYDSDNELSEIVVVDGDFAGFAMVRGGKIQ